MSILNEVITFNKSFVEEKRYEPYITSKYPDKHFVILTCMDTRLVELLPKAMNLRNGDVKIIKSAGATLNHPFGGIMRSLLVAIYELQADEVFVIGHYDCGMSAVNPDKMLQKMIDRGITQDTLDLLTYSGVDLKQWLHGFEDVQENVQHSVEMIKNHPLVLDSIPVHGLVIDPKTGKLDIIVDGSKI
ncbi:MULTISPECIES: carbonic anhydrase [unclassified Rummeliibacillus]|uniref:beta-class carbonic anhydrase n=1 Tax=unclassified Rummeliibacillus TaxID=2622809 RepID=UPI000E670BD5|nr:MULTISPECIES: carbonic anhydrase [unclassified Rummeliibacillus]RIJ68872.1 carbonic anhydrase [Rummeliibacillus sp. POC4]RPJ95929.1 carbonic anhydrase [Rummeliibacillus sp. TYF005]